MNEDYRPPIKFTFHRNETNPEIYDAWDVPDSSELSYLRLSHPRADYLTKQGARFVLESWKEKSKYFFTGLVQIRSGWYAGDAKGPTGKRFMLEVHIPNDLCEIIMYAYPFDLSSIGKRVKYLSKKGVNKKDPNNSNAEGISSKMYIKDTRI